MGSELISCKVCGNETRNWWGGKCYRCIRKPKSWANKVPGYVYLVELRGVFKIGRSRNPIERIEQLEVVLPAPIEVIHLIPCDNPRKAESALHYIYKAKRLNGEWFALEDSDVAAIKSIERM